MKLIILDRDGVINYDADDYVKSPEEWQAIPGSLDAIARLNHKGYQVVVVSNQSGLGRGKFKIDDLNRVHRKMHMHLAQYGGRINAIFFCPHAPEDNCECRKPRPGLLNEIARRLRVSLRNVYMVGDKLSDIEVAQAVGANPALVRTGYGQGFIDRGEIPAGISIYDDLAAFVDHLLLT